MGSLAARSVKVFLTGGTGLLGRHILAMLQQRGDDVTALSRSPRSDAALAARGARPLRGDLGDEVALERGVEDTEAVVHSAAIVLTHRGGWADYHAANVAPVETLAMLCAQRARRLLHISSVSVYGRATTYQGGAGSVTEDFGLDRPIFAGDHYARSKREAELALWRAARERGLSVVALRPCVVYGEGDRAFAPRVYRMVRRGVAPLIGPGHNPLSVVYAGNVAQAVAGALDRPQVTGAFNVANDGVITQRDFVRRFAAAIGIDVRLVSVPATLAWRGAGLADGLVHLLRPRQSMTLLKSAVQFLANDNPYVSAKAERELGWRPATPPAEAVDRTARWMRDHAA